MRAAAAPVSDAPALPPLFRHHVRRPRLTRLLDASRARIIVLTAPAGYGKTTLAAEWLQGRPKEEVAWYYASPASADVAALSVGIAEAVSHIRPAGERVRQRLRVPQVPDNAADILAELLADDLKTWPDRAWLVIDDYHHAMDSRAAERFVEELLRLTPLQVLITTRRRPTWVTARRVVYGEVVEISQERLSMTASEATQVLANHSGRAPVSETVTGEAWPALVALAALARTAQSSSQPLAQTLDRYLAEEVLQKEPVGNQRFMLLAALPPYLNSAVLSTLPTETPKAALADLQERGLLRRDTRGNLRFHPLLREFLFTRLLNDGPALARQAAERVVPSFLAIEDWDAAFQLATEAGHLDLAHVVMAAAAPSLLRAGRVDTLQHWLSNLGEVRNSSPETLLVRAQIALRKGSYTSSAAYSRQVIRTLAPDDALLPRAWNLVGLALHLGCDHESALRAYERGYSEAIDVEDRTQAAWGRLIATVELAREDPTPFLDDFERVISPSVDHRLRLASGRLMACERAGDRLPLQAHREALSLIPLATDPMAISHAYATGIFVHARRAAYDEALELANPAIAYCQSLHLTFPLAYCLAYRAHAEIGRRMLSSARETLAEVAEHLHSIEDAHLHLLYYTLDLKLAIASKTASASVINRSLELRDEGGFPDWPLAELLAVEALALAGRGDVEDVGDRVERARVLNHGPTTGIALALAELIARLRTEPTAPVADRDTSEVLRSAVHAQCLDAFITAYRSWPQLLRVITRDRSLVRIVQATLAAGNDHHLAEVIPLTAFGARQPLVRSLTKREYEVAALIAAGLTNAEISAKLFIAPSTAKVHVRRVLRKLRAKNRVEAALLWRDAHEASSATSFGEVTGCADH